MKKTVEIESIKIAYEELVPEQISSGIPIIFLHDSLGSITVWREFPKMVSENTSHRCIVYDRQGYGHSDPFSKATRNSGYLEEQADFLISFLDQITVETCILFGHSDGGSIALIAAAKYPGRIQGIITEGAHVFVEDITLAGIREAKEMYRTTDLKTKLIKHHGDKVDALFTAWTETWLTPEFKNWNIEHFLTEIRCPVLTLYGEKDEYGSLLQLESIYSKARGYSQKVVIPGIGHTPHKEAREATLAATTEFIKHQVPSVACN